MAVPSEERIAVKHDHSRGVYLYSINVEAVHPIVVGLKRIPSDARAGQLGKVDHVEGFKVSLHQVLLIQGLAELFSVLEQHDTKDD